MKTVVDQEDRTGRRTRRAATWIRFGLLVAWAGIMLLTVTTGERVGTLPALESRLADGSVTEVSISGEGLAEEATGPARQEIHWRDGPVLRTTAVVSSSADSEPGGRSGHTARIGSADAAEYLSERYPGLTLRTTTTRSTSSEVYGWANLPSWAGTVHLVIVMATLVRIVTAPGQPWRATRWAWFWLWLTPVGTPLYLLLSGPSPLLPAPRPGARRLTGGWAFLIYWLAFGAVEELAKESLPAWPYSF